ncbi:MAG TPA: hypothetical protein VIH18_18360 [Candidatus Binatia bacterium]|jgi:hypothetical protein
MKENGELPAYQKLQREQPLAEYGLSYFDELVSEYRILSLKNIDSEAKARADEILQKQALTWGDIYTFEIAILKLQPIESLRRRAWTLREKYRAMAGEQGYDAYLKSNPPDPKDSGEAELRADLIQLLNNFHWQYTVTMAAERMRGRLSKWIVGLTGLVVAVFVAIAIYITAFEVQVTTPTIVIVIFMGTLGGFVSTQLRLQSSPSQGEPIENLARLDHGWLGILVSPISGAIFAVVLYMLFAGSFLEGSLFPKIATPAEEYTGGINFGEFAVATGPETGFAYAKLIVWSFVAGFAERFVPDALSRIIATRPTEQQ